MSEAETLDVGFHHKIFKAVMRISIPSSAYFFISQKFDVHTLYLEEFLMVCHSYFITKMTYELKW